MATHLVGEAVAKFGEDVLIEDGPNEFVVEIGLAFGFCASGSAVLNVEEAEMEWDEKTKLVGAVGDMTCGSTTKGKAHELA